VRNYLFKTPVLLKKLYPGLTWDKYDDSSKNLYLTFDDGPIPEVTPWVLNELEKASVKATFFVVGENVRKHPEILKDVIAGGHQVGNHTYNHLNVADCKQVLEENGVETSLFRPPYGKIRRDQIAVLKETYDIIMWDYLTGDFDQSLSSEKIIRNFKRKVTTGAVVVFHDNVKSFNMLKKSLPEFLDFFKQQEYNFLTL